MKIYTKKDFADMSFEQICEFVAKNKEILLCSAVFTRNKSAMSKLISWVSRGREPKEFFVPSHVGSIVELEGEIFIFDMKPPKGKTNMLSAYLSGTEDEFVIIPPDFALNVKRFSGFIFERIGQGYGYMSALQSAFRGLMWSKAEHCSEIHLKGLQEQGFFADYNANKVTPHDLLNILTEKTVIKDENFAKRD